MNKEINYTELLNNSVGVNEFREWMNSPFRIGDKAIATDGYSMMFIEASSAPDIPELIDYKTESVLSVIPTLRDSKGSFNIAELRSLLKTCPQVPVTRECECCLGEGEVEYSMNWGNKQYVTDQECPVCDGNGEVINESGKKELDGDKRIKIGLSHFAVTRLLKLGIACKLTKTESIEVVYQVAHNECSIFRINEAELLIMPIITDNKDYVLGEISLTKPSD